MKTNTDHKPICYSAASLSLLFFSVWPGVLMNTWNNFPNKCYLSFFLWKISQWVEFKKVQATCGQERTWIKGFLKISKSELGYCWWRKNENNRQITGKQWSNWPEYMQYVVLFRTFISAWIYLIYYFFSLTPSTLQYRLLFKHQVLKNLTLEKSHSHKMTPLQQPSETLSTGKIHQIGQCG